MLSIAVPVRTPTRVAALFRTGAIAIATLPVPAAMAQSVLDDFSSGNDTAWTRFDGNLTVLGVPSTFALVGGGYRISSPSVPNPGFEPIISSVRADAINADAVISVDITDWSGPVNTGLIARGQVDLSFYLVYFTPVSVLAPNSSNFSIVRYNAAPGSGVLNRTVLGGGTPFPQVDQQHDYRIVMNQTGSLIQATLVDITTATVVRSVTVIDEWTGSFQVSGVAGVSMYSNDNSGNSMLAPFSVTFDNFRVDSARAVCFGNANGDTRVDFSDLTEVLAQFGNTCP